MWEHTFRSVDQLYTKFIEEGVHNLTSCRILKEHSQTCEKVEI